MSLQFAKELDGCMVTYSEGMSDEELMEYVARGRKKYGKNLRGIKCETDGDYVNITYNVREMKFNRLRRITGYLVGDMSRWNNAKRKEEGDRVKHETCTK